jgi:hypothetical protein
MNEEVAKTDCLHLVLYVENGETWCGQCHAKADRQPEPLSHVLSAEEVAQELGIAPLEGVFCPACGEESLFVVVPEKRLLCSRDRCPDRETAQRLLADKETEHIVLISEVSFAIQHPLKERATGIDLWTCDLHERLMEMGGPPEAPGKYRVTWDSGYIECDQGREHDVTFHFEPLGE